MPYLKIETNLSVSPAQAETVMQDSTTCLSRRLGKSEAYIMVTIQDGKTMMFGGSNQPLAYLELKSIGLPENATKTLSADLCAQMETALDIPQDRIYIEFIDAPRAMWGYNGSTFAT
jgi:phenylpyruvate tautomerase